MNLIPAIILALFLIAGAQDEVSDIIMDHLDVSESEIEDISNYGEQEAVVGYNFHLTEAWYSLFIVIGLFATSIVIMRMVMRSIMGNKHHTPHDVIMGAGLVIVVFSTLFLVIAATSTEAMMAAIGIIGSVSGYVLGNSRKEKDKERKIQIRKNDERIN